MSSSSPARPLTISEQAELLSLARRTLEEITSGRLPSPPQSSLPGLLQAGGGAFVSLHRRQQLRGCIGHFASPEPLMHTVQAMTMAAAQDSRFRPVQAKELPEISLEISVLSPLREIFDVEEIQVGRHGIYLVSPRGQGVLLPQVAVEQGWERPLFLDQTCRKAGLPNGAWRDQDVRIYIFSAQIFSE